MTKPGDSAATFDTGAVAAKVRAASLIDRIVADRYRVIELLAMGGMGAVYRGEHVHMRKRVAIKVLHPETEGFPELVTRFERESIVGAHVAHENVASASDFGRMDDGSCYLVTEFVEGTTLHAIMQEGPVPVARAVDIARQIAWGLDAVHKLGIVHRDVKPRNVMVATKGRDLVKLIDFGLAKVPIERFSVGDAQRLTGVGVIFGTVGFMSPESALGMDAVTERSDLYALGVVLYEMLTGKHPFDGKGGALFVAHRTAPVPAFRERAPDVEVPARLESVVMRLLEKSPADRFASAVDVVVALGSALSSSAPISSSRTDGTPEPATADLAAEPPVRPAAAVPSRQTRRTPQRWAIGGAAVLAGVFVAAMVTTMRAPDEARSQNQAPPASAAAPTSEPARTEAPPIPTEVAAATASAAKPEAVRPVLVDGKDASAHRGALRRAAGSKDWSAASSAVVALVQLDPLAFREHDVRSAAASTAAGVEVGDAQAADRLFSALAADPTGGAAEVLFDLETRFGGSRGGARARDLLRMPEVLGRATPALRIAHRFHEGTCQQKVALLDEAVEHGDERTLGLVMALRASDCDKKKGECCLRDDPKVAAAIKKLRERLKR